MTRVESNAYGLAIRSVDPLGGSTAHTRDAYGRVVAIADALGGTTHITWTADGRPNSRTYPDGSTECDAPQEEIDQGFHAIVTDLVGTPTQLIGPDGDVPWRRASPLWGIPVGDRPPRVVDCPLGFPGQYLDRETGLRYNRHRYYDPDSARYLSPDPLGLDAAPDHYAYVRNPYLWSDPLGLQECPVFKGVQRMTGKILSRVSFKYQKFALRSHPPSAAP